jgi:hypothetical protein
MQAMMRPAPGCTPPQCALTSAAHSFATARAVARTGNREDARYGDAWRCFEYDNQLVGTHLPLRDTDYEAGEWVTRYSPALSCL